MYEHVPYNFLALPERLSSYKTAKAVILPIPYDLTLSFEIGARLGPQAIISASRQVETYDDHLGLDPSEIGIATMSEMAQVVSGPEDMQKAIYSACLDLLNDGKFVMALGGEHSITAGLVKAHKQKYPNLSVLQIDAHADLRDSYQGSKYSHACVMARVAEMTPFLAFGIRSFCGCENEAKYNCNIVRLFQIRNNREIIEKSIAKLSENVYITIDLDGLDPSVMPSVGTPEPGGLNWDEMMSILNSLASQKKIVGADVVELSPRAGLTYADFTAAKLVYRVIARSFFKG